MTTSNISKWYAKGLLFENCNCQLISPAGRFISRAAGIGLTAWGGWMLV